MQVLRQMVFYPALLVTKQFCPLFLNTILQCRYQYKFKYVLNENYWNDFAIYTFKVGGETDEYALNIGNMTKGNYFDVLTALNGVGFTARDHDNDQWYSANCADYYRGGFWLTNCGFDLHRDWCDGAGCMSWGSKTMKKSQLKIRPMESKTGGAKEVLRPPVENPIDENPVEEVTDEFVITDENDLDPVYHEITDDEKEDYFDYYDTR